MSNTDNLVSLSMLAEEFGFKKSKLTYYADRGLLKRVATIGRMGVFDKDKSTAAIRKILKLKESGMSLAEIAGKLT